MKRLLILVLSVILSNGFIFSQCKMLTKPKHIKRLEKVIPLEIETATKYKILFDKYYTVANISYCKTIDGNYFCLVPFTRAYSSRFEVFEDQPIVFYLENGEEVTLHPVVNIDGRMIGLTKYNILLYYKASREQLEKLASNFPVSLKIYFLAEKEISNSYMDDIGTYFEYELHSNKYRNNVFDGANCILQY